MSIDPDSINIQFYDISCSKSHQYPSKYNTTSTSTGYACNKYKLPSYIDHQETYSDKKEKPRFKRQISFKDSQELMDLCDQNKDSYIDLKDLNFDDLFPKRDKE